ALSVCAIGSMFMTSQTAALLLVTILAASFLGISRLGYDEFALIRRGVVLKYYDVPMLRMSLFVVFVDLLLSVVALYGAFVLKYGDYGIVHMRSVAMFLFALLPALTLMSFCIFRIYWRTWRNASAVDLMRPAWAVVVAALAAHLICRETLLERPGISFFIIYGLLLLAGVIGARVSYQLLQEWTLRLMSNRSEATPVAIYAAGVRGTMALQSLLSNQSYGMRPVGFIDDDPKKSGKYVKGFRVFGSAEVLSDLIEQEKVKGVVVASEAILPDRLRAISEVCRNGGAALFSYNVDFRIEKVREIDSPPGPAPHPVPVPMLQPRVADLSH
ncbi:MAG TPA: hypothetical protein VKH35_09430, partial [Thermoanaerobaculia bacterium]|nr:hypothetical protein [Thermoanaerobaculia bacterium]